MLSPPRMGCMVRAPAQDPTPHPATLQTNSTSISCSKKIVVTVTIPNNNLYASSELAFDLPCVNRCEGLVLGEGGAHARS